jgi:serine/threonine-protein kinase
MRAWWVALSFASGCLGNVDSHGTGADGGKPNPGMDGSMQTGGGDMAMSSGGGGDMAMGGGGQDGSMTTQSGDNFPSSAIWYQDISNAALDSESASVISGLQGAGGFGTGRLQIDFSITVLHADATVQRRTFTPTGDFYSPDCDPVPIPVPPGGQVEGSPTNDYSCAGSGDCHLIVYQGTRLYEAWVADITGGQATGGTFTSGCAAVWDLTKDYWQPAAPPNFSRGDQCTSADAAGYPIAPLLFYGSELTAGHIDHAIRFILPNDRIRDGSYVHPATHSTHPSTTGGPNTPPYGAHLRLKSTFDLTKLPSNEARTVAKALQKYGMFLADGGNIALTADASAANLIAPDALSGIAVSDFEMVDGGTRITYTGDCGRTPVTN